MNAPNALGRSKPAGRKRPVLSVLVATARGLFANNTAEWAAAIAYYTLLSAFPLLLVAASLAALLVDASWAVARSAAVLGEFLPGGGEEVERIVQGAVAARGQFGILSAVALVWTGGRAFAALTLALNAVCDDDAPEDAPRRFLVSLGLLLGVAAAFVAALTAGTLVDDLWRVTESLPGETGVIFAVVRTAVQSLALLGAFWLVYRFVPRGRQSPRAALVGAAAATALFLVARPLFLFSLQRSETYRVAFGPLALAAILMVWAWVVAFITLFGGQLVVRTHVLLRTGAAEACGSDLAVASPAVGGPRRPEPTPAD